MTRDIDWTIDTEIIRGKGEIRILGSRVAMVNIHTFKSFRDNMIKIAGPVADHLIYLSARDHTMEYVSYVLKKSDLIWLQDKIKTDRDFIPKQIAQILTQFGYGKSRVDRLSDDEMMVTLENSAIGVQYEKSKVPVCSHIAGQIAGGATAVFGMEYDCKEVECVSKGDSVCKFLVKPKEEPMRG